MFTESPLLGGEFPVKVLGKILIDLACIKDLTPSCNHTLMGREKPYDLPHYPVERPFLTMEVCWPKRWEQMFSARISRRWRQCGAFTKS